VIDPVTVVQSLHDDAADLDTISKRLYEANQRVDRAEAAWDLVYDANAESLKDEMVEDGRKGDPAEHWITSVTRRQHRVVYQELRNAKREVERLERQLKAKTSATSARQSELKVLQDEARAQDYLSQRRHAA
jgi:hypothetical protein